MATSPPSDSLPGPIGRYRPVRLLGRGGMAEVFLADFSGPGGFSRRVALKMVLPAQSANPEVTSMFLDEARIAAHFTHPNLVPVFDFGEVDGRYFMAMEYARGLSLRQLLRQLRDQRARIPDGVLAAIGSHACAGLAYAHALTDSAGRPLRIVHRDITPENLFLTVEGVTKVLDFGIVRAEGRVSQTQQGTIKGKPAYMSPEQARARDLDGRSDVFSLGVSLWECLTSKRRYGSSEVSEILRAIVNEPAPDVRTIVPDCNEALAAVVTAALERDRDRRPTAADLQGAFDALLAQSDHSNPQVAIAAFLRGTLPATPLPAGTSSSGPVSALTPSPEGNSGPDSPIEVESLQQWPVPGSAHDPDETELVAAMPAEWDAGAAPAAVAPPPAMPAYEPPPPGSALSRARGSADDAESDEPLELNDHRAPVAPAGPELAPTPEPALASRMAPLQAASKTPAKPAFPVAAVVLAAVIPLVGIGIVVVARRPPPPPPPPAPTAPITIPLSFVSDPASAAIFVDGADTGLLTPALVPVSVYEDHTWSLTLKGYLPLDGKVTKDQLSTPIRVALMQPMELSVDSTPPGAAVDCDGKRVIVSTPDKVTLSQGEHTLRATKEGFVPLEEHVAGARDHLDWKPTLDPAAYLDITSEPSGAKIAIDGVATEMVTPVMGWPVRAGKRHEVTLSQDALRAKGRTAKAVANGKMTLALHLVDPSKAADTAKLHRLEAREAALEAEKDGLEAQNDAFILSTPNETRELRKREKRIEAIDDELATILQQINELSE